VYQCLNIEQYLALKLIVGGFSMYSKFAPRCPFMTLAQLKNRNPLNLGFLAERYHKNWNKDLF